MAYYKNGKNLTQRLDLSDFDRLHSPGDLTPNSGIYRCEGCTREMVSIATHPFPPQNHHQHSLMQGDIRWRLVVMATHV